MVLQHKAETDERRKATLKLPQINIDGATGTELATPLGTVVTFDERRCLLHRRRLGPAGRRRERRAGAAMTTAPPIEARGLVKRYGHITAVDDVDLDGQRRRRLRLPRAERRRQDDVAADAARADPARRGQREAVRARPPRRGGARPGRRRRLRRGAALLPVHERPPQPRDGGGARRRRRRRRGSTRRSTPSTSPTAPATRSAATRTACASGSASPARCCATRGCCCSTSRPPGLDPGGMRDMRALIKRLAGQGITVLLSSHLMGEVEELCDRVAIVGNGRVLYEGSLPGADRDHRRPLRAAHDRRRVRRRARLPPARHQRRRADGGRRHVRGRARASSPS